MATPSSWRILSWRIPWTEDPGASIGSQKSQTQLSDSFFTLTATLTDFLKYLLIYLAAPGLSCDMWDI